MRDPEQAQHDVDPMTRQVINDLDRDMAGAPVQFVYRELVVRLRAEGLRDSSIDELWEYADAISDGARNPATASRDRRHRSLARFLGSWVVSL